MAQDLFSQNLFFSSLHACICIDVCAYVNTFHVPNLEVKNFHQKECFWILVTYHIAPTMELYDVSYQCCNDWKFIWHHYWFFQLCCVGHCICLSLGNRQIWCFKDNNSNGNVIAFIVFLMTLHHIFPLFDVK